MQGSVAVREGSIVKEQVQGSVVGQQGLVVEKQVQGSVDSQPFLPKTCNKHNRIRISIYKT